MCPSPPHPQADLALFITYLATRIPYFLSSRFTRKTLLEVCLSAYDPLFDRERQIQHYILYFLKHKPGILFPLSKF